MHRAVVVVAGDLSRTFSRWLYSLVGRVCDLERGLGSQWQCTTGVRSLTGRLSVYFGTIYTPCGTGDLSFGRAACHRLVSTNLG